MNTTWGYSEHDHAWKSDETLIRNLIDIASKGGNYLLNIGPKGDGSVPEESVKSMRAIGAWMKVNGESIYATTASPFAKLDWGRCTQKQLRRRQHAAVPARLRLAAGRQAGRPGPVGQAGQGDAAGRRPGAGSHRGGRPGDHRRSRAGPRSDRYRRDPGRSSRGKTLTRLIVAPRSQAPAWERLARSRKRSTASHGTDALPASPG